MRNSLLAATVSAAALALSSSQPLVAQNDVDQQLGNVHLKTSCNEVAQRRFDRGMRYQHSYWYVNAKEVFEDAIKDINDGSVTYRPISPISTHNILSGHGDDVSPTLLRSLVNRLLLTNAKRDIEHRNEEPLPKRPAEIGG